MKQLKTHKKQPQVGDKCGNYVNEVAAYWNVDQLIFLLCLFSVMVKNKWAMKCRNSQKQP